MATEKQIAANRANALRSTGPKTLAGRLKSSRNAYRHGLSLSMTTDPSTIDKADVIARFMVDDPTDRENLESAKAVVQAQLELLRIRAERKDLATTIDLTSRDFSALGRLLALDRYAQTKRRRVAKKFCQNEANRAHRKWRIARRHGG